MLQNDYLMKMFVQLAAAIRRAVERHDGHLDEDTEASREGIEEAIGLAAEMDSQVLLSLEPESAASILWLGNINDSTAEYIVHSLMLDADYLDEDGYSQVAALRRRQAGAIAETFKLVYDPGRLDALLNPTDAKTEQERIEFERQYGVG